MARVYLKGLPQLKRKLILLKERTADKVRPAMERAAQQVTDMMRRQAPVDDGDLRDSIGWTFGEAPRGSITVAAARAGSLRVTIFAGNAKAYYARFVEFGTAPHVQGGMFPGTQHQGNPPQPFFFTSWRAMRKEIRRHIAQAVRDAVREVAR